MYYSMAEKMECKVSLYDMPRKNVLSASYKIEIQNFFAKEKDGDTSEIKSPPFQFAHATVCFIIRKVSESWLLFIKTYFKFRVSMIRLNSKIPEQTICYRISLQDDCTNMTYKEKFGRLSFSEYNDKYRTGKEMICDCERYDGKNKNLTLIIDLTSFGSEVNSNNMQSEMILVDSGNSQSEVTLYQLPTKNVFTVSYRLEVPNFFSLLEYDTHSPENKSPPFEFAHATWCFRFELDHSSNKRRFCVYMTRLSSKLSKQIIFYNYLLEDKGLFYKHDPYFTLICYGEGKEECLMDQSSTFIVHVTDEYYSEEVQNAKRELLNQNTLTLSIDLIFLETTEMKANQDSFAIDRGIASHSQDFKDVLLNGEDHNITFNVKDKTFRAHRDILRARCEVFRSMLTHDMLEKKSGIVDVPDCEPQAFQQFLFYIYTGKVEAIDENNMFGLYYAADKYDMQHLKEKCCEFIKKSLSVTNVCEAIKLAVQHSDDELLNCTTNFFISHADDVFPTLEWRLFLKENPIIANELFIETLKESKPSKSQSFKKLKVSKS